MLNEANENTETRFILQRCKREEYIKAWNHMYLSDKDAFNKNPLFDDINPSLNKVPLNSETDNFCTVIYDSTVDCSAEGFEYGKPVGIFSFVVTPRKVIGKQYVVHPSYHRMGLGKALLLENEKTLIENGYSWYYIGCSKCSSGLLKSFGRVPYSEDVEGDMFKYNVDLGETSEFKELYNKYITEAGIKVV